MVKKLYAGGCRNGRRWGTSRLSAGSLIGHGTRKDTSNDAVGTFLSFLAVLAVSFEIPMAAAVFGAVAFWAMGHGG